MGNYYFLFPGMDNWNYLCSSSLSHQKSNFPLGNLSQNHLTFKLEATQWREWSSLPHVHTQRPDLKPMEVQNLLLYKDRKTNDELDNPTTNWGFISWKIQDEMVF